jgi:hypothetical protein
MNEFPLPDKKKEKGKNSTKKTKQKKKNNIECVSVR